MLQLWSKKMLSTLYYTFKIIPTPSDAIVTINGEATNSVTLTDGSEVTWSVEADGYAKQSGTVVLSEDTVMDIVLEEQKDPLYARYVRNDGANIYIKCPIGSDNNFYGVKSSVSDIGIDVMLRPTSSSQLIADKVGIIMLSSLTEDTLVTYTTVMGTRYQTYTRDYEGDFYS